MPLSSLDPSLSLSLCAATSASGLCSLLCCRPHGAAARVLQLLKRRQRVGRGPHGADDGHAAETLVWVWR